MFSRLKRMLRIKVAKPDLEWRLEDATPVTRSPQAIDPWAPVTDVQTMTIAPTAPMAPTQSLFDPELVREATVITSLQSGKALLPTLLAGPLQGLMPEAPTPQPEKPRQMSLPLSFANHPEPREEIQEAPQGKAATFEIQRCDEPATPPPMQADAWSSDHGWDLVEPVAEPQPAFGIDLPLDIDLPDFDADARQDLWIKPPPDPPLSAFADYPELQAALKAERILRHLRFKTPAERDRYLNWLVDVFLGFHSAPSFEALERLAKAGELDAPLLRDMVALKREWRRRPEWWMRRSFAALSTSGPGADDWPALVLTGTSSFHHHKNGQWLLTWGAARRICLNAPQDDPIAFVEDLLDQWLQLSPPTLGAFRDPAGNAEVYAFARFIQFVHQRAATVIEDEAATRLIDGLRLRTLIELPI